jgi:GDP-mannose 6-dehydrogenase
LIEVIERLIGKGYDLRNYDKNVNIKAYGLHDIDAVLNHTQAVVIGTNDPEFNKVSERLQEGQFLIDFVRIIQKVSKNVNYDGICW